MAKVKAIRAGIVNQPKTDGQLVTVNIGDEFSTRDPIVREYPWLFENPVEQATAAPGEQRDTRRTT